MCKWYRTGLDPRWMSDTERAHEVRTAVSGISNRANIYTSRLTQLVFDPLSRNVITMGPRTTSERSKRKELYLHVRRAQRFVDAHTVFRPRLKVDRGLPLCVNCGIVTTRSTYAYYPP